MIPDINFESLSYSPFSYHENSINSKHDRDINFYQDISSPETHYCTPNYFENNFQCFSKDFFYILHLTLFRMEWGGEGGREDKEALSTSFPPVTSTEVGISPQNFLTFSFNPFFHTGVKFQVHNYCQSRNYWT